MTDLIKRIESDPYDAHIAKANEVFRSCGFTIAAMQFPRSPDALVALKQFNGLADDAQVPFGWRFHPNAWSQDNWRSALRARGELA